MRFLCRYVVFFLPNTLDKVVSNPLIKQIQVTNMCIVREEKDIINRVEMDTKFDFNLIKHILISDAIKCPFKPGFVYVNVLLFTDKPLPIIIPYLYRREKANKLNEWLLINADGVRVRHHVDSFQ